LFIPEGSGPIQLAGLFGVSTVEVIKAMLRMGETFENSNSQTPVTNRDVLELLAQR
jgi:hypothetical protein